jgi:hypothetical protein
MYRCVLCPTPRCLVLQLPGKSQQPVEWCSTWHGWLLYVYGSVQFVERIHMLGWSGEFQVDAVIFTLDIE